MAEAPSDAALSDLRVQIQAALALSRATLQAVAAISEAAQAAAEAALEDEAEHAPPVARRIVEDARDRLADAPAEAHMARALQQTLVSAAAALPAALNAA